MDSIRRTIVLSTGPVTLCAWGAGAADGHLIDLFTLTATLGELRREALAYEADAVEPQVWAAFWRLTAASVARGSALAGPLPWPDVLAVLDTLWDLNDVEEAEGKLGGLTRRLEQARARQAPQTTPSTNR
ncbi:hypothetical protein [Deinococcus gobiensis]|uniref:Uncharacterized protein n=1 Tax=Deinococcus gobiensis (strain DSM 21396 / JCM 16679 / CGMCC 1.7299 / I-0) TaxID=745776 RepID=H8GXQ1_DEIGI|nr:hypothetical protein [Deinococcus gobiensis]AFD25903.1 hypothetical protein DGo_CA1976 [Deinococcus gobiensis I-0]